MPERGEVVLVDEAGSPSGISPKKEAHDPPGRLHLAFSVFLFRPDGTILVQRRAATKYHFAGVWGNACCSHPEPGEDLIASAERRVSEELGLTCELRHAGAFTYRARDEKSGLVEHEFDHVLIGETTAVSPDPDPNEVDEWAFVDPVTLEGAGPAEGYAPWFAEALAIARAAREG